MRTWNAGLALPAMIAVGLLAGCTSQGRTDDAAATPSDAASSRSAPASTSPASASASAAATSPAQQPTTAPPPSSASTSGAPSAPAAPPACATDHLRLAQGRVEGAAGSTYVTYYLMNVGASTCVLDGHPGFALLRANGSVIQHPADRSGTPAPVRVAPLAKAQFVVRTSDPGTVGEGQCSYAWKTAQVQVYPPDQTKAIRQPSDVQACNLVVDPVTAP